MHLFSLSRINAEHVHHADDVRPEFYDSCREAALMDAPAQFPRGSAFVDVQEWGAYDMGFCGSREYAGRSFCPPAGASSEVNEAASSPAAPAASGQSVGIPAVLPLPGVSVLFARSDSCYFGLANDVWDMARDARNYAGNQPVVCHPPCRAWGRLRHFAKPRPDEKALALFAVDQVRRCGGVLEHPWGSTLWQAAQLPLPGHMPDAWGGFTLLVDQGWWGHAAPKPTYLYVVGVRREDVPPMPVQLRRAAGRTLDLSQADRERTPPAFARWLVDLALICGAGRKLQPAPITV
ncbi:MAG: hypothetical protein QM586_09670, partial [Xenophilus sp.]